MKNLKLVVTAFALVMFATASYAQTEGGMELLPPNPKPGECYARVFAPAVYETTTETVLKKDASTRIEIMPAKWAMGEETILVKEGSERIEVIPATYKWAEERVMVKPESKELRVVPAVYQTASEQILDQPAHTVWKKGRGLIEKVGNTTGEIMCLIEVPATYRTVTKRTLKTPARTEAVSIPAEYKTVKKQVIGTPPSTRTVVIPAEYKTIPVRKMTSPATERAVEIPAEYQTITKRSKVSGENLEWRTVLCETNMSTGKIMDIQRALSKAGYDPGPIDGYLGSKSASAIASYQRKNGLATGGITMKTLQSLGVASK